MILGILFSDDRRDMSNPRGTHGAGLIVGIIVRIEKNRLNDLFCQPRMLGPPSQSGRRDSLGR